MKQKSLILITGATGFTGRHACDYFTAGGMEVIPITRRSSSQSSPYHSIDCDLLDETAIERLIQTVQPDYVLHLAGLNDVRESWMKPMQYVKTNVNGTLHLLEAVRTHAPECRVCITGSALQYSPAVEDPPHPYSFSKTLQAMISEAWNTLFDMNILFAKPTNLIGPGNGRGICSILAKKIVEIEKGAGHDAALEINNLKVKRDFLDVRDVVEAYKLILLEGEKGKQYEIGTGTIRTIEDVVKQYRQLTPATFIAEERHPGKAENRPMLDLEPMNQLGWLPRRPFSSSLADTLEYYRSYEEE